MFFSSTDSPSPSGSPTKIVHLERLAYGFGSAINLDDGREYIGDWKNGERHGYGTTEWSDGRKYAGSYIKDYEEGIGKLTWNKGKAMYQGDFNNGLPEGEGESVDEKNNRYIGQFLEGKKHGKGKIEYSDGSTYEGQWLEDQPQGSGVYTSDEGDNYDGFWKQGRYHGRGILRNPKQGIYYFGDWNEGKKEGPGILKQRNGSWEQGLWQSNALIIGCKVIYSKGSEEGYRVQILEQQKKAINYHVSPTTRLIGSSKSFILAGLYLGLANLGLYFMIQLGLTLNFLTLIAATALILLFPVYSGVQHIVQGIRVLSGLSKDRKGSKILDWTRDVRHITEPSWQKIFPNG